MQGAEFAAKMRGGSDFETGGEGLLVCGDEPDFSQAFRFESMLVIRSLAKKRRTRSVRFSTPSLSLS